MNLNQNSKIMKRYYYFILFLFVLAIFNTKMNAQHIDAGPDITLCPGETNTTLHADVGRLVTGRYRVESIPFVWDGDFTNAQDVTITDGSSITPLRIDDRYGDAITLPFPVSFYGRRYDKIVVGSNGDIIFEPSVATDYDSWSIDSTELIPNHTLPYWDSGSSLSFASIMGAYHDIDISVSYVTEELKYKTVGTAPNRKFIVIYNDIPQFSCNTLLTSQEIVFNESDFSFEVHIKNKPVCAGWNDGLATLGTQNEELLPDTCGNYPGDATSATLPNRNTGVWDIPDTASEAYKFIPDANVTLNWYDQNRNVVGTDADISLNVTETTIYTLEANFEDCHGNIYSEFDEVTVTPLPEIQSNLPVDPTFCTDETYTIDGTVTNASDYSSVDYAWADAAGTILGTNATLEITTPGIYTLNLDIQGCTSSYDVNVSQYPCVVPQGISPNGDGKNDTFILDYLAADPGIDILQIFDRRGVKVYEKDGYTHEFEGKTDDGKVLPAASYFYVIKLMDGEKLTGWVQIVR